MSNSALIKKMIALTDEVEDIKLQERELRRDIRVLRKSQDILRQELLVSHPHRDICLWFSENQAMLATYCSKKLNAEKYFAEDLSILFNFFDYVLVCLTEKPVAKDIAKFKFMYEKALYVTAFSHLTYEATKCGFNERDYRFFLTKCIEFTELIAPKIENNGE